MPELPEVETIKRGLEPLIVKKKIVQVEVDESTRKAFQGDEANAVDVVVKGIRRRGKALLIDLDNGHTLMIHLRMTGQLIWRDASFSRATLSTPPLRGRPESLTAGRALGDESKLSPRSGTFAVQRTSKYVSLCDSESSRISSKNPASPVGLVSEEAGFNQEDYEEIMQHQFAAGHPSKNFMDNLPNGQTRVSFVFEEGTLYFNDQRKFGFVKVIPTSEVEHEKFIAELAKEPWEMSVKELFNQCQRHKSAPIKAVLLDQKIIAGLGNIYADESLFYASVHPATKAGDLTEEQVGLLLEGARSVMLASIDSGGSTMATYVKPDGSTGSYLENFAQVFRREGKPCIRCGEIIQKTRVAGRGTHYCPKCQKLEEGSRLPEASSSELTSGGLTDASLTDGKIRRSRKKC